MDVGLFLLAVLAALVIAVLFLNDNAVGGAGCLAVWGVVAVIVGANANGVGLLFVAAIPIVGALLGFKINYDRREHEAFVKRRRRSVIPDSARTIGSLWYMGGVPGFDCIMVELMLDPDSLWLASVQPPEVDPYRIPLDSIRSVSVDSRQVIATRSDIVGGLIWGGGGSRRVESLDAPVLQVQWVTSVGAKHEVLLQANSPLPSSQEENRKASILGSYRKELSLIRAEISTALPTRQIQRSEQNGEVKSISEEYANCPWCAEAIRPDARICRFCDREINSGDKK